MKKPLIRLALVIIMVSLACGFPVNLEPTSLPTIRTAAQFMVVASTNSTATPTPFQPVGPTLTPTLTSTPQPSDTPEPDPTDVPEVPTPIRMDQEAPEGTFNFLVLGNDLRPSAGFRTDVMMLVSINGSSGTVSVVSFPRDLYVTIPGWTTQRLNTVFAHGGFSLMADTFEYNFGVRPTHYIMTNFEGFIGIINSMGGIDVNVGSYFSDKCDVYQNVNGYCTVDPGVVNMDGGLALWYVRSRYTSSDFDRTRRAQEVLYGVFARLMSMDAVTRLPEMYVDYKSSVETDLGIEDIAPLLPVAAQVLNDSSRIRRFAVGPEHVTPFTTYDGAMVLLPNNDAIHALIAEAISSQ